MQNTQNKKIDKTDLEINEARLELYTLLGEGYRAMKEGRTSTMEEVEERLLSEEKASE